MSGLYGTRLVGMVLRSGERSTEVPRHWSGGYPACGL